MNDLVFKIKSIFVKALFFGAILLFLLTFQYGVIVNTIPSEAFYDSPLPKVLFGDVNGDGYKDSIFIEAASKSNIWVSLTSPMDSPSDTPPHPNFGQFRFSPDHPDELLSFNIENKRKVLVYQIQPPIKPLLYAYYNLGNIIRSPWVWLQFGPSTKEQWKLGDMDGDGKADLVYIDSSGSGQIYVGLSSGKGFSSLTSWQQQEEKSGSEQFHIGDADGDRKEDLIFFDTLNSNEVRISLSAGDHFLPPTVWITHGKSSANQLHVGDINGDQKVDLIYFDTLRSRGVWFSFSQGNSFSSPQFLFPYINVAPEQLFISDINQDGKTDITYYDRGRYRGFFISLSSGAEFETHPWGKKSGLAPIDAWRCERIWKDGCYLF